MHFRQISALFKSFRYRAKSKTEDEPVHCKEKKELESNIVWGNVVQFSMLHLAALYGVYLIFISANWKTLLFAICLEMMSCLGITAGAHRLWSHRSYKAKWPLRVFLCLMNTIAFQNDIYEWSRDHRIHHKFAETDADPHNIKRGFFFAHIGWLMCKKHPDVIKKGKTICLDDLMNDPIVRFQRRFYSPLVLLFSFYMPTMIPVWCWGETAMNSFFVACMVRYCISMNCTFLVNSAAHTFGKKPFDKKQEARENPIVSLLAVGEGWHNYHHAFPWDYSTSELNYNLNFTKLFIDTMSKIGQAYDLKTVNTSSIETKKLKSGDGTRLISNHELKHI